MRFVPDVEARCPSTPAPPRSTTRACWLLLGAHALLLLSNVVYVERRLPGQIAVLGVFGGAQTAVLGAVGSAMSERAVTEHADGEPPLRRLADSTACTCPTTTSIATDAGSGTAASATAAASSESGSGSVTEASGSASGSGPAEAGSASPDAAAADAAVVGEELEDASVAWALIYAMLGISAFIGFSLCWCLGGWDRAFYKMCGCK